MVVVPDPAAESGYTLRSAYDTNGYDVDPSQVSPAVLGYEDQS